MTADKNERPSVLAGTEGLGKTEYANETLPALAGDSKASTNADKSRAIVKGLADRMCTSHCWRKTSTGLSHVDAPFDAAKLNEHLFSGVSYGLSPIAPGESTTRAACLDLDSHRGEVKWSDMWVEAERLRAVLESDGYAVHPFRSSGGAGVHLLLVWDRPQDAHSVREVLRGAVELCGFTVGVRGIAAKEVEAFPKQSSVPPDGAGSMWVLPLSGLSVAIGEFTGWRPSPDVPIVEPPPPRERTPPSDAPDLSRLRSALDAIPNAADSSLDYDAFRNVVFGIHHATDGSDEGFELTLEFSARSPKHDEAFLTSHIWPYVDNDRPGAVITERSIFSAAAAYGWQDPAVADAFDVLPIEPPPRKVHTRELRLVPIDEIISNVGPVDYLVDGYLERDALGTAVGEPGSYKSFLTLDWALSVATGRAWHGSAIAKPQPVVYVAGEGHKGFGRRLTAWGLHHDIELRGLPFCLSSRSVMMMDRKAAEALEREVKTFSDACGAPVAMVVIDTFARNFGDGDENQAKDVNRFVDHVDRHLREPTGASIVVVHHTGLSAKDRGRGSSALKGAIDFEYLVETPVPLSCLLSNNRMKDAPTPAARQFRLVSVPLDANGTTSLVLEHVGGPPPKPRKAEKVGANERLALRVMQDLAGLSREAPTINELADVMKDQMGVTGQRDRRRELAMKAINSVIAAGTWHVVDGRVRIAEVAI